MEQSELLLEPRLTKVEIQYNYITEDIKEIKINLRWIIGLLFGLNGVIIGLLAKAISLM